MQKIMRDFVRREMVGIGWLFIGFWLGLWTLVFFDKLAAKWLWLGMALIILPLLRLATTATMDFRMNWRETREERQQKIVQEYAVAHRVLPLYQGELHLLGDSLIWRSRRRLGMALAEDIDGVKLVRLSGRNAIVWDLYIFTAAAKKYKLEFIGQKQERVAALAEWLREQGGKQGREIAMEGMDF